MKVRTFVMRDYLKVRELWVASGLEIRPGDEPEGIARKLLRDPRLFLVAEENGEIVGTVMGAWDGRRGWIYHLGVRPDHHRKGVATRLIAELESRMKRAGIPKVNALIYPSNEASLKFFASAGYGVEEMKEAAKWLGPTVFPRERVGRNGQSAKRQRCA